MSDPTPILVALQAGGLTPNAAAGVVGNTTQESQNNPTDAGGGLAQWQGSRLTAMQAWTHSHGQDPTTAGGQAAFIAADLKANYPSLLKQMNAAATPGEAALLFSQQYERPGIPMNANREKYAQDALKFEKASATTNSNNPLAGTNINPLSGIDALTGAVGSFFNTLTSAQTWLRVGEGLAGMVLIYIGLRTLTGNETLGRGPMAVASKLARA